MAQPGGRREVGRDEEVGVGKLWRTGSRGDEHPGARLPQPRDYRGADPLSATGDERPASVELPAITHEQLAHAILTAAARSRPSSATLVSRMRNFWTLPVTVIGKPSTNFTYRGIL